MKIRRRSYFTLIEIVMIIALLAIISGTVAINIRNLVGQQSFQNEVTLVVDTFNRAQQLMLIYNQNVRVKFTTSSQGLKMGIETDCQLDPVWEKWITRHSLLLKEIHTLAFQDLNSAENDEQAKIIRFYPKGGAISRGIMALSTARTTGVEGAFDAFICLPGYPKAIHFASTPPEDAACKEVPDPQIASLTKFEVLERAVSND